MIEEKWQTEFYLVRGNGDSDYLYKTGCHNGESDI